MKLSSLADDELTARVRKHPWQDGGAEAFGELWRRHERWIKQRIHARRALAAEGCNPTIFEEKVLDRVQENLIRGLPKFRGECTFRSFVFRVIETAAVDEYRYQKRRPEQPAGCLR